MPEPLQFPSSSELVISMRNADFIAKSLISASTNFSSLRAASARFFDSVCATRRYSLPAFASSVRNPPQNLILVLNLRQFARNFDSELHHLIQGRTILTLQPVQQREPVFHLRQMFRRSVNPSGIVTNAGAHILHADARRV